MMAEGVVVAASAGENATASFWGEPLLCGSHAFAGGTPLRGAKPCVLGFCVRGVLCVGDRVSWFFANLHLGFGGGLRVTCSACRGPAVHWLGVLRACGPLARRSAGRRSTQASLYTNMPLCKLGASYVYHGPTSTNPNVPSRGFPPRRLGSFPRQSHAACCRHLENGLPFSISPRLPA